MDTVRWQINNNPIRSNSSIINLKKKIKTNDNNALNKVLNYITLSHTYNLLYLKGHNPIKQNYSTIKLIKENNR